jgi:hypothetical protein
VVPSLDVAFLGVAVVPHGLHGRPLGMVSNVPNLYRRDADEQKERERENQSILYKMDIPEFESSLSRDLGLV